LGTFALVRSRQRCDTTDPWVEALGDPLDHAAFAGGIAAFENHHDLLFVMRNPILQLDQLALQAEQLSKVELPIDAIVFVMVSGFGQEPIKPVIVQLHFIFFIEAVGQIGFDTFSKVSRFLLHNRLPQLIFHWCSSSR